MQAVKLGAESTEIIFAMRVAGLEILQGNYADLELFEPQKVAEQGKDLLLAGPHTLWPVPNIALPWSVRICGCRRPFGTQQAAAGGDAAHPRSATPASVLLEGGSGVLDHHLPASNSDAGGRA